MKKIAITTLSGTGTLAVVLHAQALDFTGQLGGTAEQAGYTEATLVDIISSLISVILSILGVLMLIFMLYAGFLWMTAGGDSKQVDKAKETMVRTVIGLIIIVGSYAISTFVIDAIQGAL